jgi:tetratricopeptide (TPR) repeat protein
VSLTPGSSVSHYRLIRPLGAGGMGEVFLAQDLQLDRMVAIKFLTAPADDHARRRLLREARAAASLDHPCICAVYEVGTDPVGGDFIAMQHVEGELLAARLRDGRLGSDEAIGLCAQIAEALAAAHRRGIVHRDLKPRNVIITPSGAPKLLDFGLAKRVVETPTDSDEITASQLTDPNALLGTPGYMSPEQVRGQRVDARTDVFALGCVLYECLTGRRAFAGSTTADTVGQILHVDPPAPSAIVPGVGAACDAACLRMLAKNPADRFQSAEETLGALRSLLPSVSAGSRGLTGVTPRPILLQTRDAARARPWRAALAATAIAAGIWLAIARPWRPNVLDPAPPGAAHWYDVGVEALREGSFAGARDALNEAIGLHPSFVQAYSRLADACAELDDDDCAQKALLRVTQLVPDRGRLPRDEQQRLEAVQFSALREHDKAIAVYKSIADRHPTDPGAWVDVGRAREAIGQRPEARMDYQRALGVDPQFPAAHLRLGAVVAQGGDLTQGLASLDEAIRLYDVLANEEGKAEGLLRKATALNNAKQPDVAKDAIDHVLQLARDRKYLSQQIRARFELARVNLAKGQLTDAESTARSAVDDATAASLFSIAANGLIDLAGATASASGADAADALLERAMALAKAHGAVRPEMRAKLQQAAFRSAQRRWDDAVRLAEEPLRFYTGRYPRQESTARNILAQAYEELERYDEASRLSAASLRFAEAKNDPGLITTALYNVAGLMKKQGRLTEALAQYERIERLHRERQDPALAFDLPNRAEIYILLGRGRDAATLLDDVDRNISRGEEAYVRQRGRVTFLRALQASIEQRWNDAQRSADAAAAVYRTAGPAPTDNTIFTAALAEHARARLARGTVETASLVRSLDGCQSAGTKREISYWIAQTLLARKAWNEAYAVSHAAWTAAAARGNPELGWRLAAVAAQAAGNGAVAPDGASMPARSEADLRLVSAALGDSAAAYLSRPDLAILLTALRR